VKTSESRSRAAPRFCRYVPVMVKVPVLCKVRQPKGFANVEKRPAFARGADNSARCVPSSVAAIHLDNGLGVERRTVFNVVQAGVCDEGVSKFRRFRRPPRVRELVRKCGYETRMSDHRNVYPPQTS